MLARSGSRRSGTSSRARCSTASTSSSRCRGRAPRSLPRGRPRPPRRSAARVVGGRARLAGPPLRRTHGGGRAPRPRRRAAAALGPRARAGRPRRSHRRRARRLPTRSCRSTSPRLSPTARRRSWRAVSELALAIVRSRDRTRTVVGEPARASRFARLQAQPFDAARRELARLERRSGFAVPRPLRCRAFRRSSRAIHDPPPGLFLRGDAEVRAALPAGGGGRRRTRLLRLRPPGRAAASAASSPPRASSSSAGSRAESTPRRIAARSRPAGRRSPCSAAASTATIPAAHRELARQIAEHRARRLRVRTGRRARAVALPGAEPDRGRPLRGDRRRRGARAKRRADHGRLRARGGPRGASRCRARSRQRSRPGPNALLRLGATPLTCAQDVLESYGHRRHAAAPTELGRGRRDVLERIREGAAGADELARATGLGSRRARGRAHRARAGRARRRGGRGLSCRRLASRAWPTPSGSPEPAPPLALGAARRAAPTSRSSAAASPAARARSRCRGAACGCACTRRARSPPAPAAATAGLRSAAARWHTTARASGSAHDAAADYWRLTEAYVDRMAELGGDAFRRTGSLRLAGDDERDELRAEYEALREDGFAAEWRDDLPEPLAGRFPGALFHPDDAVLQPARLVRRLAARRGRGRRRDPRARTAWQTSTSSRPRRSSSPPTATRAACSASSKD